MSGQYQKPNRTITMSKWKELPNVRLDLNSKTGVEQKSTPGGRLNAKLNLAEQRHAYRTKDIMG